LALLPQNRPVVAIAAIFVPVMFPSPGLTGITRYVFLPVVALSFWWLLQRPSFVKAVVFASLLFAQTLLVPELTLAVPGFLVALIVFEWRQHAGRFRLRRFVWTVSIVATSAVLAALFALWLAEHRALQAFVDYYRIFGRGHMLKGTQPIFKGTPREFLQMVSPVAVFIAGLWWFFMALRFRWTLMPKDYVALAMLVLGIFYFQKFVWRADRYHLYQAFVVSAPIVAYMAEKVCRGRTRAGAVFALALLAAGPTLARITESSPRRIAKQMPGADY